MQSTSACRFMRNLNHNDAPNLNFEQQIIVLFLRKPETNKEIHVNEP